MLSCSRCGRFWCTASAIHDTLQPGQSALVGKDTSLPQAAGEGSPHSWSTTPPRTRATIGRTRPQRRWSVPGAGFRQTVGP